MSNGAEIKQFDFLLRPAAHLCQECAVKHAPEQPHNQQSLYYQVAFQREHGRWPTWRDAMAHCSAEVKDHWVACLRELGVEL